MVKLTILQRDLYDFTLSGIVGGGEKWVNLHMQSLYYNSILAGGVATGVLALCLFLVRTPEVELYRSYRRSKILLGMGYAVFSIGIFSFVLFPLRSCYPMICPAVNLTYYFGAALLFGYSFISLLNPHYYCRERTVRFGVTYCVYVVLLWLTAILTEGVFRRCVLAVFGGWFLVETLILSAVFLRSYRSLSRRLNDFYADATATFIRWLNVSSLCVIFFGLLCGVCAFLPHVFNLWLMIAGIGVFVYIYVSVQNYALHLHPVQVVAADPVETEVEEKDEAPVNSAQFVSRLDEWVNRRGYIDAGLTLNRLAEEICTNRSYLSAHINATYNVSFSDWINGMRIDYAKEMMKQEPALTLDEIACRCGFSSQSYFSRLFRNKVGCTPSAYKSSRC